MYCPQNCLTDSISSNTFLDGWFGVLLVPICKMMESGKTEFRYSYISCVVARGKNLTLTLASELSFFHLSWRALRLLLRVLFFFCFLISKLVCFGVCSFLDHNLQKSSDILSEHLYVYSVFEILFDLLIWRLTLIVLEFAIWGCKSVLFALGDLFICICVFLTFFYLLAHSSGL